MTPTGLDLAYLRERPDNVERLIEHQRIRETPIPGGDTCRAQRLTLDDGTDLFTKTLAGAPAGFFEAEAQSLRWLAAADAVPLPEVIAVSPRRLVLTWIEPGVANAEAMARLGRAVGRACTPAAHPCSAPRGRVLSERSRSTTHRRPRGRRSTPSSASGPTCACAVDNGRIARDDARAVDQVLDRIEALAGPPEPPARLHGDLWGGNLLPARDGQVYLVDPAAHGGHRETDLAMLALFGAPHLDALLEAYDELTPLSSGWPDRVGLHQLHPLLVHAASFGGGYGARAGEAARRYR